MKREKEWTEKKQRKQTEAEREMEKRRQETW